MAFVAVGCEEDVITNVSVSVHDTSGNLQTGVTVYMFSGIKGPGTAFYVPFHSNRSVVTEDNGVANFELQEVFDLEVIDTQTTLYFAVFGEGSGTDNELLGDAAVSVKAGEDRSIDIEI